MLPKSEPRTTIKRHGTQAPCRSDGPRAFVFRRPLPVRNNNINAQTSWPSSTPPLQSVVAAFGGWRANCNYRVLYYYYYYYIPSQAAPSSSRRLCAYTIYGCIYIYIYISIYSYNMLYIYKEGAYSRLKGYLYNTYLRSQPALRDPVRERRSRSSLPVQDVKNVPNRFRLLTYYNNTVFVSSL